MRVIVAGSIDWVDIDKVRNELVKLPAGVTIICNETSGSQHHFVSKLADELRFDVETWPTQTDLYGTKAPRVRNQEMIESGVDLCVAFPVGKCMETWDCIRRARGAHIETVIVR
tara:strand:+ start:207 stop:548 length:342 start_codon:yes stop_codon:yes gene_type:complete